MNKKEHKKFIEELKRTYPGIVAWYEKLRIAADATNWLMKAHETKAPVNAIYPDFTADYKVKGWFVLEDVVNDQERDTVRVMIQMKTGLLIEDFYAKMISQGMPFQNARPKVKEGLERYPEFRQSVNELADEIQIKIKNEVSLIESTMPYKEQFLLEELIAELKNRV